jgi:hypothetical protein
MLIPRAKKWIEEYYPGTKLGITEYNWGAEADMSGAIALADSLGIFAEQKLDLACYWTWPPPKTKTELAFRLFRNVDGKHTKFPNSLLETKIQLTSLSQKLTSNFCLIILNYPETLYTISTMVVMMCKSFRMVVHLQMDNTTLLQMPVRYII